MRIAFFGTPAFAVPTLDALIAAGHDVGVVVAQPDAPAGRGMAPRSPPVVERARGLGIEVRQPRGVRTGPFPIWFTSTPFDVAVVLAYGRILPQALLDAPRWGCVNVHASLLPRWRGAAPIQAAIAAGDAVTGVATQRMVAELDAGDVYDVVTTPIGPRETGGSLHDRLSVLAAQVAVTTVGRLGRAVPSPQVGEVSWAPLLTKAHGQVHLEDDAEVADRRIRAMTPWPGGWVATEGGPLKLLEAEAVPADGVPGTVLGLDPLVVALGRGALRLDRVLAPGRGSVRGAEWARQRGLRIGAPFPALR